MSPWYKKIRTMERPRRLSIFFGILIFLGLMIIILGILSFKKITPYATYKNRKYGFEIKFPSYWQPIRNPQGGAIIIFASPKQDELDQFQENVNISIKDMPQAMTIEHFSTLVVNQVAGTFREYIDITETIPIQLGGHSGYRLSFVGTGKGIENPVEYVTAWTIVGNRAYIITFTGLKRDYPLFEKKVNTMINSFKLSRPETP